MKKRFLLLSLILVAALMFLTACGSSGSNNSSNSSTGTTNTESSSTNDSTANDSGSSSDSMANDTSSTSNGSSSGTGATANVIGDWQYEGMVNNEAYDITLDLESNSRFELEIDQESADETVDSKATGTYVSDDKTITLSIATVQDTNGAFTGAVVQNEQVNLDYTMSDNGNTLTISNAPDSIAILPGELTLIRD